MKRRVRCILRSTRRLRTARWLPADSRGKNARQRLGGEDPRDRAGTSSPTLWRVVRRASVLHVPQVAKSTLGGNPANELLSNLASHTPESVKPDRMKKPAGDGRHPRAVKKQLRIGSPEGLTSVPARAVGTAAGHESRPPREGISTCRSRRRGLSSWPPSPPWASRRSGHRWSEAGWPRWRRWPGRCGRPWSGRSHRP